MNVEVRELDGSVALVTGGGQGLGLAFVEVLTKNGAYVSISMDNILLNPNIIL